MSTTPTKKIIRRQPPKRTTAPTLQSRAPVDTTTVQNQTSIPLGGCPKVQNNDLAIKVSQRERQKISARSQKYEETLPTFVVENIRLSVIGSDELMSMTNIRITDPGPSGLNTVNDPRLGVLEPDTVCNTCYKDTLECPGHYGYIPLNVPVYHPLFIRYIVKVLNIVCNKCGGLLLTKEHIKNKGFLRFTGYERLTMLEKESKGLMCRRKYPDENIAKCTQNPEYIATKIKETGQIMFKVKQQQASRGNKKDEHVQPIEKVEEILNSISPEDAELMGFENGEHPRKFIMKAFPVIPPCNRPSLPQDGVEWPDHLTMMYMEIISKNNEIPNTVDEMKRSELIASLNSLISHFIDNTDGTYSQGQNKEFKTIKQRIQGKEAYIRNALMGKRVNYSARTVLSPDPSLKFGQVRIPRVMASVLTVPVVVTQYNREAMSRLMKTGKITHIIPSKGDFKGSRLRVTDEIIKEYELRIGDKVDRHLQNGDTVLFNRQPTLHKFSMMGYEVVLSDQLTIGLHLSVTTPHNADFDGDEGNLHSLQTVESIVEAQTLMNVKDCIMNAQNNRPTVGIVYDALTGAYLLTQENTLIDETDFYNGLMSITNKDSIPTLEARVRRLQLPYAIEEPVIDPVTKQPIYDEYPEFEVVSIKEPVYTTKTIKLAGRVKEINEPVIDLDTGLPKMTVTTKQVPKIDPTTNSQIISKRIRMTRKFSGRVLFSALLPEDFYYRKSVNNNEVLIINGVLVSGVITKDHIGTSFGSIIQALFNDYGRDRAVDFLTDAPFVINQWLTERGFSVGIKDCYPTDNSHRKLLQQEITKARMAVEAMGQKLADPIEEERREKQVIGYVNVAKNIGGKISTEKLSPDNQLRIMAESGAKGTTYNIAQITGMLGQQFVREKRMPESISGGTRSLPYFQRGELNPQARGFVQGSFLTGLSVDELFFHQAGGREGLMDTAVKTSETGSIHHRIIKLLEDVKVAYDGSVRNGVGTIFQFIYGEDGFDASFLEKVKTKTGDMASFIDLKRVTGRLNAKFGFVQVNAQSSTGGPLPYEQEEPEIDYGYEEADDGEGDYGDFD